MNLDEFKRLIKVLPKDEAENLRDEYVNKLINRSKDYFKKYIENIQEYSDGFCYTGYLWDCLNAPIVVDLPYIESKVDGLKEVFVFWDIHTKERIFIEDYWKFDKDSVIALDLNLLLSNLDYLPEDIYIFDKSLEWTLVLTHEYIDDKRWCLKSGNI